MSKIKQHYQAIDDYAMDNLYDYQALLYQEELESRGEYIMTKEEEIAYNKYMEGKLCGNQETAVHTSIDSNLRNGQSITGSNATLKYRKRKSVE